MLQVLFKDLLHNALVCGVKRRSCHGSTLLSLLLCDRLFPCSHGEDFGFYTETGSWGGGLTWNYALTR